MEVSRSALSPTPRKSERERKMVSYDKLHSKGAPNSDCDSLSPKDGFGSMHHHGYVNHQSKDKTLAKKHSIESDNNSKK